MFIVSMASNLNMTRTPDVHFISEARTNGAKFVVLAPDFSQITKYFDQSMPTQAGQDGALFMAVNHVILKEFYVDRQVPYFLDYLKRYTDCPFLVELVRNEKGYRAGRFLQAHNRLAHYKDIEDGGLEDAGTRRQKRTDAHAQGRGRLSLASEKRSADGTSPRRTA